ncbi:Replicase polyprotein 1ab [Leucoagaricus sp. SymC.cos]|nr:Replicase polyprotein 1ab [Leucoagaricus sp. SymC.cos]
MPKSKTKPPKRPSTASPPLEPLSDVLVNIDDHEGNSDDSGDPPSQFIDALYPCIFHLYFGICGNVDCKFSHSIKSIASRPPSRGSSPLSDGLPGTPRRGTFPSRGLPPCRYFLKGHCRFGNQCSNPHEKAKSKFDGPWRNRGGSNGGTAYTRPREQRSQKMETRTTDQPSLAVQEIDLALEATNARIQEIFDDAEEADNTDQITPSPNGVDQPGPPPIEPMYQEPPPQEIKVETVAVEQASAHDESEVQYAEEAEISNDGEDMDGPYVRNPSHSEHGSPPTEDRQGSDQSTAAEIPEAADDGLDDDERIGDDDEQVGDDDEQVGDDDEEVGDDGEQVGDDDEQVSDDDEQVGDDDEQVGDDGEQVGDDDEQVGDDDEQAGDDDEQAGDDDEQAGDDDEQVGDGDEQAGDDEDNKWGVDLEFEHGSSKDEATEEELKAVEREVDPSWSIAREERVQEESGTTHQPDDGWGTIQAQTEEVAPSPAPPAPVPSTDARQTSMMSLHWCRFADPTVDPNTAFCKAFAQNKCSNISSDTCMFRHCLTPNEYTLLFKDPQPLQFSLQKDLIRNDSPENATLITSPSFTFHWSHFADPTCDPTVAFCKSYAEHMCPYDTACNFRHCLTPEEYTLLFNDPQPNLISLSGTKSATETQPPTSQHVPPQRAPCMFFRKGNCKNGANCSFLHDLSSSTCPNILSSGSCNDPGCTFCSSASGLAGPSKKPCDYWPKGKCKNGDTCPFAHIGESGAAVQAEETNRTWGNDAGDNQAAADAWGADFDNGNTWDDEDGGNLANVNEDKEEEKEQQAGGGWGDTNQGTGWGGQINDNSGWGDQNNNNDDWGTKTNDQGGGGNQTNDQGRWRNDNKRSQRQEGWSNDKRNGTSYNDRHDNRDSWNDNGPTGSNKGVCYKFQQGRCWRGSDCRFSHDVQPGGSGGHGSRDAPQPRQTRNNFTPPTTPAEPAAEEPVSPAPAPRATSTYGGRGHYDRGYIDEWKREVAASSAGSEAGGSRTTNRRGNRGRGRGQSTIDSNRSVEHPSTGNAPCQFHLVGRCSNGDTCPSSHVPVVPEIGIEGIVDRGEIVEGGDLAVREVPVDQARVLGEDGRERREDLDSPSHEVEEVVKEHDNSANHVVDSKWGRYDQWDDKPAEIPEEMIRINKPCLHYGQGFCMAGEHCRFLHIDPEQQSPERSVKESMPREEEAQEGSESGTRDHVSEMDPQSEAAARDYGHPLVERSIFGCTILFGRDCLPDKITTGTDSHVVLLEGSPDVTEARVHDFVNKYGPVKDIQITQERPPQEDDDGQNPHPEENTEPVKSVIRVEFKEMKDAATAAKDLNAPLEGAVPIEFSPIPATWVRFRWPQATRAAWIYYSSITKAKTMAEKLNGTLFQQRKITVSFLRPDKRQKDLYAIKIERLPPDTTRGDLVDIAQEHKLITTSELTYNENPREILQQWPGLKSFINVPDDPTKINAVAFARLDSGASLSQVLQMNGERPKFLGKQELVVERVWFTHYELRTDAYRSVSTEIAALHIQCEGRTFVDSSDYGDHYVIYLHAPLEEVSTFKKANLTLQSIIRGMTVISGDGKPEWDGYFYSTSSIKVIENLNSKNAFHVIPNLATRRIHVLGPGVDQDKGVSMVKKLLQKVRGSYQEHPIHRNVLQKLTNGGLSEIQGDVGATKLSLDVLRSVLIVRGGDAVLMQKIRHLLDFSPSNGSHDQSGSSRHLCSICELQPGGGDPKATVKLFCGHTHCMACLQHALIFAANNHSAPVRCIGRVEDAKSCGQSIPYTTIRDLLPLLTEPEYLQATLTSFVHSNLDEFFFCPSSLRCDAVYRRGEPGDMVRCPICRAWICLYCGSLTHDGMDCMEAEEARKTVQM